MNFKIATYFFLTYVACSIQLKAQETGSYIYIEGIKTIPFTVSINKKEVPLISRLYYIAPINTPGENVIDVRFAGNLYPNQQFILDANTGSSYGFKLAKTTEDKFYLLDLVNNGKIIETNSNVNIGLSTIENTINYSHTLVIKSEENPEVATTPANKKENRKLQKVVDRLKRSEQRKIEEGLAKEEKARKKKETEIKKKDSLSVKVVQVSNSSPKPIQMEKQNLILLKNNCPTRTSDTEVNSFLIKMLQKGKDEDRLIVLKKKYFSGCVNCKQLYSILEKFNTGYIRVAALKFMRTNISDTENLMNLEPLFKGESNRTRLKAIMYQ